MSNTGYLKEEFNNKYCTADITTLTFRLPLYRFTNSFPFQTLSVGSSSHCQTS